MIDHILYLMIPIIYLFSYYKINLNKYKPSILSFIIIFYLLFFNKIDQILYDTGKDL